MKRIIKALYLTFFRITRRDCRIEPGVSFGKTCTFEGGNLISAGTSLRNVYMGYGSYTSDNCLIRDTMVGKYTCIGPNVVTAVGRHPSTGFVSLHPAFYSVNSPIGFTYVNRQKIDEKNYLGDGRTDRYSIAIGNDVWIGAGVTILDGIAIGDGAIVAAGSVVTKSVPPYTVVGGVPAKEIKKRFAEEQIEGLMKIRWWEKEISEIKEKAEAFESIDTFMAAFDDRA